MYKYLIIIRLHITGNKCAARNAKRPPGGEVFVLGCGVVPFSNSLMEDLNKIWELRHIIPDPTNPFTAKV